MSAIKTTARIQAGNIKGAHENKYLNEIVFFVGAFLAGYTIYSLFKQNKLLSLQQQHMMMEIDKMEKDGIQKPQNN